MTANPLRILVPSPEDVRDLGDGYYAAPLLLDGHECASFTPCHLKPVVRRVGDFEALGQVTVRCLAMGLWDVRWDLWKTSSKGFALWIE